MAEPPATPERRIEIARALARYHARLARKVLALRGDLTEARRAGELRAQGEALLAYLRQVPARAERVVLPDPADPARSLTIELDPRLSPQGNAARLFKRAARGHWPRHGSWAAGASHPAAVEDTRRLGRVDRTQQRGQRPLDAPPRAARGLLAARARRGRIARGVAARQGEERAIEAHAGRGRGVGGLLLAGPHRGQGAGDRDPQEVRAQATQGPTGARPVHPRKNAHRAPRRAPARGAGDRFGHVAAALRGIDAGSRIAPSLDRRPRPFTGGWRLARRSGSRIRRFLLTRARVKRVRASPSLMRRVRNMRRSRAGAPNCRSPASKCWWPRSCLLRAQRASNPRVLQEALSLAAALGFPPPSRNSSGAITC